MVCFAYSAGFPSSCDFFLFTQNIKEDKAPWAPPLKPPLFPPGEGILLYISYVGMCGAKAMFF